MDLLTDIWRSLLRSPTWVMVWMSVALLPANLASLFFLGDPLGPVVAVLTIGGLLPNVALLAKHRGFTSVMGVPHTIAWIPLLVVAAVVLVTKEPSTPYAVYLALLIAVNGFSLVFDVADTLRWSRGEVTTY